MVSGPLGQLTGDPGPVARDPGRLQLAVVGPALADRARARRRRSSSASIASARTCATLARLPARRARSARSLWISAAVAFRLTAGVRDSSGVASDDPSVTLIGQAVNAVVSTVLWAYLASVAILLGGELNAVLRARRAAEARAASARRHHQRVVAGAGGDRDLEPAVGPRASAGSRPCRRAAPSRPSRPPAACARSRASRSARRPARASCRSCPPRCGDRRRARVAEADRRARDALLFPGTWGTTSRRPRPASGRTPSCWCTTGHAVP